MPQIKSEPGAVQPSQTENSGESLHLDLSELDLNIVMQLEGTALGGVIKEMREPHRDQPNAGHRSYDKFKAHGTINWGR